MKNYVTDGNELQHVLTEAVEGGDVVVVNNLVGIAVTSGEPGEQITVALHGVYTFPVGSTNPIEKGKRVYADKIDGKWKIISESESGDESVYLGFAWNNAPANADFISVKLNASV
jgi:predicted RecA/RadA family phage recombinase